MIVIAQLFLLVPLPSSHSVVVSASLLYTPYCHGCIICLQGPAVPKVQVAAILLVPDFDPANDRND